MTGASVQIQNDDTNCRFLFTTSCLRIHYIREAMIYIPTSLAETSSAATRINGVGAGGATNELGSEAVTAVDQG